MMENNDVLEDRVQRYPNKEGSGYNISNSLNTDGLPMPNSPMKMTHVSEQEASNSSDLQFEKRSATSGPAFETIVDLYTTKRKRRYSSGSLRRKPEEDAEDRGSLKYFEEADDASYKNHVECDNFQAGPDIPTGSNGIISGGPKLDRGKDTNSEIEASDTFLPNSKSPQMGSASPLVLQKSTKGVIPITRPVNPKEAQTQRDKRVEFFLLLEDLTAGMKRPCIMDLKMGTRQYGVDANEKKRSSQRRKCAETTSKELGVRVCGLQVWDVKKQSYIFQDKYFGRKLKAGREFQDALQRFLFDGVEYASILRHIPTILRKLSELEVLIKDLRGYRFYAASLLMFYDGEVEHGGANNGTSNMTKLAKGRDREIDFKIADFANCVTAEHGQSALKERACPPQHPNEPDKGFLRGLKSLRRYFIKIQKEVTEIERRGNADGEEAKNVIANGNGRLDDFVDEDLGEVSY
jgi:hypothetical protein